MKRVLLLLLFCVLFAEGISLRKSKLSYIEQEEENVNKFSVSTNSINRNLWNEPVVLLAIVKSSSKSMFELVDNTNSRNLITNSNVCAVIEYKQTLKTTGWDIVNLESNKNFGVDEQMYCAGFLEGYATSQAISDFYYNISDNRSSSSDDYKAFFTNIYERTLRESSFSNADPFWKTSRLLYIQLLGVRNGANQNNILNSFKEPLQVWQLSLINTDGQSDEIDTLIVATKARKEVEGGGDPIVLVEKKSKLRKQIKFLNQKAQLKQWEKAVMKSRCSVFVKLLTKTTNQGERILEDIIASHSTWESYSSMNRMYKFYTLPNSFNQHTKLQMSSYPGAISSTDDFIIKESKVLITETSISPLGLDIIESIDMDDINVTDFFRVQSSLLLSDTGREWTENMQGFSRVMMYSSEWSIIDIGKLKKSSELVDDSFIVYWSSFEKQIVKDMTADLVEHGYFASFNNPLSKEVRDYLGYTEGEKSNKLFKYENDPRNQIFEFFAEKMKTIDDVKWLMQHNPYKKTYLQGEPKFDSSVAAIGARGDLSADSFFGEVDAKVVDLKLLQNFQVEAISGPSHEEQEPFSWGNTQTRHKGHPDKWEFNWVSMSNNSNKKN